jgi:threonylcarbamoyladenosine tRNA methylthiotransferase MtaB
MKTVAFYTLGCKLNYSETSAISRIFEQNGYQKVDFHQGADVYIINTCSVTDNADKKCRKIVKEALRHQPHAYIAIVGCYAQLKPHEIANIPGVDAVLGAAEKFNLINLLGDFKKSDAPKVFASDIATVQDFNPAYSHGDRTRTFLKVQDGCDYSCAFCTIPLARGSSRSTAIHNIVAQAQQIAAQGTKEIVLTGVNIGDYGIDATTQKRSFGSFLDLITELDKITDIQRFRISSIEPNLLTAEIIDFVAQSQRFVPHFHIPLQSGAVEMLKNMRRRYKREVYTEKVAQIKQLMPHCCIGVDVIVGHPGETDDHFLETYNYLNELDVSYLHVFTYSERPNTHALTLSGTVPAHIRSERSQKLHILSEKKRRNFYKNHLNQVRPVLFEYEHNESGIMHGFTDNYIKIKAKYDPVLTNEIRRVALVNIDTDGLVQITEPEMMTTH